MHKTKSDASNEEWKPGVKPKRPGRDKPDVSWESGVWLGVRDESGEIIIGTVKGVLKARSLEENHLLKDETTRS